MFFVCLLLVTTKMLSSLSACLPGSELGIGRKTVQDTISCPYTVYSTKRKMHTGVNDNHSHMNKGLINKLVKNMEWG